jgi:integrase
MYLSKLRVVCAILHLIALGFTKHVARHTAATVVFVANDVSLENISKILGHSST